MPVIVPCPSCRSRIKVPGKILRSGRTVNCPKCKTPIDLAKYGQPDEVDVELISTPSPLPATPIPSTLLCPHCQGEVFYDISLAGQAVTCPYPNCQGQFLMPSFSSAPATAKPPGVTNPGAVRVTVLVKDRAVYGHVHPDLGAVVLLIPAGKTVKVPWPGVVPGNWLLMRQYLPSNLKAANFSQAHSILRRAGGYAATADTNGQAAFPSVESGDYTILILLNTVNTILAFEAEQNPQLVRDCHGVEICETLLDRHFGLDIGNSKYEEFGLRSPLRSGVGHEGQLSVLPGEETPYEMTI